MLTVIHGRSLMVHNKFFKKFYIIWGKNYVIEKFISFDNIFIFRKFISLRKNEMQFCNHFEHYDFSQQMNFISVGEIKLGKVSISGKAL